jgi:hypothetical protein
LPIVALCYGLSADSAASAVGPDCPHLCCNFRRRFFVSLAFTANCKKNRQKKFHKKNSPKKISPKKISPKKISPKKNSPKKHFRKFSMKFHEICAVILEDASLFL